MLRKAIVEFAAPTLAGIKTGNIFSVRNEDTDALEECKALGRALV